MSGYFYKLIFVLQATALVLICLVFFQTQADTPLTVYLSPNQVPVAQAGFDQTVDESAESTSLSGTPSSDTDGDTLEYLWAELVDTGDGCSLLDVTAAEPIVTVLNRLENYSCTFQLLVSDGRDESDPDSITLLVTADNDAPTMVSEVSATIMEGSLWQTTLLASDPEGGQLLWELQDSDQAFATAGIALDQLLTTKKPRTVLSWQPNYSQAGNYPLTVHVSDGANTTVVESIVTVQATNRVPILNGAIGNLTVQPTVTNSLLDLTDYFSDPDGDLLSYSLSTTDSTVETHVTITDDQLWLRNQPAPQILSLRVSALDTAGTIVTSNTFTVTVADWVPDVGNGLTSVTFTTKLGGRYIAALKTRRGHNVKIYNASGQKVVQSELSPGATWWLVDSVTNQNNTVDLLFAGKHKTRLYLRHLRFDPKMGTLQLLDGISVPQELKRQPEIDRVGSTVWVKKNDGTLLFQWSIALL